MKTMDKRKSPLYECCGIHFPSSRLLGSHMATCHLDGLICLKCNQTFNAPAKFRNHQLIHSGKKEFVCKICNFATVHKYNAKRHFESHERTGNRALVRQSHSIRKSKKTAKSFVHRWRKAGNMTSESEKIEPSVSDDLTKEKLRKRYGENHKTTKNCRDSRSTVRNLGQGRSGNSATEDKSLISTRANEVEKSGNNSATVGVGVDKQLSNSSRPLGKKGCSPMAGGHIARVNELHPLLGLAAPFDLPTDSIQDEARQIKSQMSVLTSIPTLLPLLERLLELSASITNRISEAIEKDVRFEAVECLEYLLNTTRMSIIRWEDLTGRTSRDAALSAIVYVYGTLPVFVNWEKQEHLEMLENIILLILNTVKNRRSPLSIRSQVKSKVDPRMAAESVAEV